MTRRPELLNLPTNSAMNFLETSPSAIDIGLSCLGCIDDNGASNCTFFANKTCTMGKTTGCMRAAMRDFSEAKAEIVIATISVMSRKAKSVDEMRKGLKRVEELVAAAA